MAGRAKIPLNARQEYDDVELAVKELGSLWVLDRINSGLAYTKKRREEMREKRERKPRAASPPSRHRENKPDPYLERP